jgi:hypothetical protein
MKALSESQLLIVGLARNCEEKIESEVQIITAAFSTAKTVNWLVIESDSDDGTLMKLEKLSKKNEFEFITLGVLRNKYPKRTERIAKCRNHYLEEIRTNTKYRDIDYVIVVDLDGVNSKLTKTAVESCWRLTEKWDVCFANQSEVYYDIWALRHPVWCPNDCWKTYKFLFNHGISKFEALQKAVYSRMIKIKYNENPIEVNSAFGGLGVYKKNAILSSEYFGLDEKNEEFCEHVSLHTSLREKGYRLYIVPSLINCGWNDHSQNSRFLAKIKTRLVSFIVGFVTLFLSKQKLKVILKKLK